MTRSDVPPAILGIRNPQSIHTHIAALKALKHDIIGHDQRKESCIKFGIVRLLVRNLSKFSATGGRLGEGRAGGSWRAGRDTGAWRDEDEVLLHSVQILSCLAHGGLAYVTPLVQAEAVAPLLGMLQPSRVHARLIAEALRAVGAIAEALASDVLASPERSMLLRFSDQLFSNQTTVQALARILAQEEVSAAVNEQVTQVLMLLCVCLKDSKGRYQRALMKAGVLDFICCRLAALAEATGIRPMDPIAVSVSLPSPPRACLAYMLEALACLCHGSAYRSMRILCSRHLHRVFPVQTSRQWHTRDAVPYGDSGSPQPLHSNPIDQLLPKLQAVQPRNEKTYQSTFPPLGAFANQAEPGSLPHFTDTGSASSPSKTITSDEWGSLFFTWLMHIARNSTGRERLAALELLSRLVSALDQKIIENWDKSSRNRDRTLALLVVPLLVRLIDSAGANSAHQDDVDTVNVIRERAPIALAILIKGCPVLQKAAYDAHAENTLAQMLKKSFDPVLSKRKAMWKPIPSSMIMDITGEEEDATCTLGEPALSEESLHRFRCRAAGLRGLAAIAQREDSYRRAIIDINVVACLVDSLVPYPDGPVPAQAAQGSKEGNPWFVIVAACRLAQALSRSVGVLRTKLLDAGIAKPVFALLEERDVRVREAATDVVTNLVLHFSPMREDLLSAGVVKILCDHAKFADSSLQHSSLWALKHLCASSPNETRMAILEELGTNWLFQMMSGESMSSSRSHMATPNAVGERVDILNASDEPLMDVDQERVDSSSGDEWALPSNTLKIPSIPPWHRAQLRAIRREEDSPALRAQREDIRVQVQTLDLCRNFISEAGPRHPDMVDQLLQAIGPERFFECLATKLKPKRIYTAGKSTALSAYTAGPSYLTPAGKRPTLTTPGGPSSTIPSQDLEAQGHRSRIENFPAKSYQDEELILSTLFVLIHVANGRPHHRHTLLGLTTTLSQSQAHTHIFPSTFSSRLLPQPVSAAGSAASSSMTTVKVLDLTLPLFSHPSPRVRVAVCWLMHNMLWVEDSSDVIPSRNRARELRTRGFEEACRSCKSDMDMDTRERAKGCVEMFSRAPEAGGAAGLEGGEGRGGGRSWEK